MSINKPSAFAVVHISISRLGDIGALTAIRWHSVWKKKTQQNNHQPKTSVFQNFQLTFQSFC